MGTLEHRVDKYSRLWTYWEAVHHIDFSQWIHIKAQVYLNAQHILGLQLYIRGSYSYLKANGRQIFIVFASLGHINIKVTLPINFNKLIIWSFIIVFHKLIIWSFIIVLSSINLYFHEIIRFIILPCSNKPVIIAYLSSRW